MLVNVWAMDVSVEYTFIPPWTCDAWITCAHVCMCVCKRGIAERNEGHPDDLESCMWRRLIETYQYWWVFFCFCFFQCVCMKNTSTAWPVLSLMDKHWPSIPSLPSSLFVNRHTSDCQGISHVGVLLTLTYFICVVWGSISFSLLSVMVGTQGLVWNTVKALLAVRCHTSCHFLTDKIKEWPACTSFPGCAVMQAFYCPHNCSSNLRGIILISLYRFFPAHPSYL